VGQTVGGILWGAAGPGVHDLSRGTQTH